jgi:hypothetical protein
MGGLAVPDRDLPSRRPMHRSVESEARDAFEDGLRGGRPWTKCTSDCRRQAARFDGDSGRVLLGYSPGSVDCRNHLAAISVAAPWV